MLLALLLACAQPPDFEKQIAPLLVRHCLECHAGDEPAGKLDLTREAGLHGGGKSGPAFLPEDLAGSPLMARVTEGKMPPPVKGKSQALAPAETALLRDWLAAGAPWPKGRLLDPYERSTTKRGGRDLWSLQPQHSAVVPPGAHPVDHWVEGRLRDRGWVYAPPATKPDLLRRLSIDLTGLPPTLAEVQAFVADNTADAYEKQVDRLLASLRFGERWARHWLDVARWAETSGYERDQEKPFAWKYREWLINAFNSDMPLDRFIQEQLAGDELPDKSAASVIATGFLRLGTWNDEPNDANEYQYDRLEDLVHATSTAFLAITIKCARCHDHKFDPIPQRDYYRVASAFWAGPVRAGSPGALGGPPPDLLGKEVLGWTDLGNAPPPIRLLKKGDPARPGVEVPFGLPSLVTAVSATLPSPTAKTTGRRLALARWIADTRNPLTARVWVNRLWMHHLGEGLVRSVDNFGFNGDKPTHPELLDFLAAELGRQGGHSKPLHRLVVTSRAYRQAVIHPRAAEYEQSDAGNQLLWRANRRRLDAESLRDAMLLASGQLDLSRLGGPSFIPEISAEALEGWSKKGAEYKPSPPAEQRRRTLYAFVKRGLLDPAQTVFDAPDSTLPCGKRDSTTVAPQALTLLNNPFSQAQGMALALRAGHPGDDAGFAHAVWRLTLAREPSTADVETALRHLRDQSARLGSIAKARQSLALVLLNTNEFIFVD